MKELDGKLNFSEFAQMSPDHQRYYLYEQQVSRHEFTTLKIKIYTMLGVLALGSAYLKFGV